MLQEFRLPDVGEGLTEAEILSWRVRPGDEVVVNQPLVEIETAKAAVELPSPYAGTVSALPVEEGRLVEVGTPIIAVEVPDAPGQGKREAVLVGYGVRESAGTPRRRPRAPAPDPHGTEAPEAGPPGEPVKPVRHGGLEVGRHVEEVLAASGPVRAKPPVRRLARERGVDLAAVDPTGPHGDVTREDVERAARITADVAPGATRGEERIPVRGVLRAMADAMVRSAFTAPHVTEWVDVDVTESMALLDRLRDRLEVRVTPLTLVAAALLQAVRRNPRVNAFWDESAGEVVVKHFVNLGIAADTPRGLLVPNVKDADTLPFPALAEAIDDLVSAARAGTLTPQQTTGGTITITNVGVFGVDGGTPIINPGEAAILAMGRVVERPWVVNGAVVPRQVIQLSLSFDHRMVDGALGSRVLGATAAFLADPAVALLS